VNRHGWREVKRQIRESGAPGAVAVLMVTVATAWGGLLLTFHHWVREDLLGRRQVSTVVAVLREPGAASSLTSALAARPGGLRWTLATPPQVQTELAQWFPELAPVLQGLDAPSFPALLRIEVEPASSPTLTTWLGARPEVVVVASSAQWQSRLDAALRRIVTLGLILAAALLAGCFIVVLLVVRLLVLDHADEISIMRLIGARERDIRLPYVALGLVLGITGGLLGVLVLSGLDLALRATLPAFTPGLGILSLLPLGGAAAGAGGAALGLSALPNEP
jgi:cell division transport system permease protein